METRLKSHFSRVFSQTLPTFHLEITFYFTWLSYLCVCWARSFSKIKTWLSNTLCWSQETRQLRIVLSFNTYHPVFNLVPDTDLSDLRPIQFIKYILDLNYLLKANEVGYHSTRFLGRRPNSLLTRLQNISAYISSMHGRGLGSSCISSNYKDYNRSVTWRKLHTSRRTYNIASTVHSRRIASHV